VIETITEDRHVVIREVEDTRVVFGGEQGPSGVEVADGDKGDITVTGDGTVWTIDSNVVSNAKLADVPTATLKGRVTAAAGDPEDLTAAQARALLNVADGATANSTDAELRDRATHAGTQAIATVVGLQSELDTKQPLNANLTAEAGLTGASDQVSYYTGVGAKALASFTGAARTLVAAIDAAAQRVVLGLGSIATQNASAVAITGGAIGGTVIGGTTPAAVSGTLGTFDTGGVIARTAAASTGFNVRTWTNITTFGAIYATSATPGTGNYSMIANSDNTHINAATTLTLRANNVSNAIISSTGIYIGVNVIGVTPTAKLHFQAGSATAGTAPIKLTSGPRNTAPVAGQIQYDDNWWLTGSDAVDRRVQSTNFTAAVFTITPPGSNVAYQNATGYPLEVFVTGGTVTAIDFSRDGTTWLSTGITAGTVRLSPLDRVRVVYSADPVMTGVPR
jgi:hypothetical protein